MKHPINMRLDTEVLTEIKRIAQEEKKTFTQLVTDILLKYIRNYNRQAHVNVKQKI